MADIDIDCIDGTGTDRLVQDLNRRFPGALRVNSLGQMVRSVEDRLGGARPSPGSTAGARTPQGGGNQNRIHRLRIFAHGSSGSQGLGRSRDGEGPAYRYIRSDGGALGFESELRRLNGRFAPGGWVELQGCSVGKGSAGRNLVAKLANLWNVNVSAGTAIQQPAHPGFETHFIVASPDGTVSEHRGVAPVPPPPLTEAEALLFATVVNPISGAVVMVALMRRNLWP